MTIQNTQTVQNDEIDLVELIFSIWRKKLWVILITVIFAIGSVLYALNAKEQWTSKAEIIAPYNHEVINIFQEQSEYALITDTAVSDISGVLYALLTTELRSVNSKVDFFKQSELYKKLTQDMQTAGEKQGVLRGLVNNSLKIKWPNKEKKIDAPSISFSAETPEDAQKTLIAYLDYLSQSVFVLYDKDFLIELNHRINSLRFSLKRSEERIPLNYNIQLETQQKNLERALSTAKMAGIREFAKTAIDGEFTIPKLALGEADIKLSDDGLSRNNFLFLMGEKYLQAQMNNVEKTPLIFPAEYHYQKTQLQQLEELLKKHKIDTNDKSFHYQSAPYLPLQRDKPKRALIVLIGTFLGAIIGLLVALIMAALDNRKTKEKSLAKS